MLFIVLMRIAAGDPETSLGQSVLLLVKEAFGAILIGIEVLLLEINFHQFIAGLLIIPLVLLVRLVTVGLLFGLLGQHLPSRKNAVKTLIWGGLRGGIAVAPALSIPQGPPRGIILFITCMVVAFSIVVQGLTIKKILERWGV